MTDTVTFSCFWPSPVLGSNSRAPRWKVVRATKQHREAAHWTAKEAQIYRIKGAPYYDIECAFCPPDNRKRDRQNFPHLAKAYIDGIADALGVDDHVFNVTWINCAPGLGLIGFSIRPANKRETMH